MLRKKIKITYRQRKKFHNALRILPNNTRFRKITKQWFDILSEKQFQSKIIHPSKLSTRVIENIGLFTHAKTETLLCTYPLQKKIFTCKYLHEKIFSGLRHSAEWKKESKKEKAAEPRNNGINSECTENKSQKSN